MTNPGVRRRAAAFNRVGSPKHRKPHKTPYRPNSCSSPGFLTGIAAKKYSSNHNLIFSSKYKKSPNGRALVRGQFAGRHSVRLFGSTNHVRGHHTTPG